MGLGIGKIWNTSRIFCMWLLRFNLVLIEQQNMKLIRVYSKATSWAKNACLQSIKNFGLIYLNIFCGWVESKFMKICIDYLLKY